jgi:hypothetical protein
MPSLEPVRWLAGPPRALLQRAKDVVILDPARPSAPLVINPDDGTVLAAGESLDGELLAVISSKDTLHLFRTADGARLRSIPCPNRGEIEAPESRPIAFRRDKKLVAAACKGVVVAEVDTGKQVASLKKEPPQLAFHDDTSALIGVFTDDMHAWSGVSFDQETGPVDLARGRNPVRLVLSPDGRFVVVAIAPVDIGTEPSKHKATLMKTSPATDLGPLAPEEGNQGLLQARFAPDGGALFLEKPGAWTRVIAPSTMRAWVRATTPPTSGYAPSVAADGGRAFVFSEPGSSVVDVKTGEVVTKIPDRSYMPSLISPDGAFLVEPGRPGAIVRSATDGKVLLRFGESSPPPLPEDDAVAEPVPADGKVERLLWMGDHRHLLAWGDQAARLVDTQGGAVSDVAGGILPLLTVNASHDGGAWILVGQRGVELRRASDGALLRELILPLGGEQDRSAVALSQDGKRLAQVGERVRVWDVESKRLLLSRTAPIFQPWSTAFTPDPGILVIVGPASFVVMDVENGKIFGEEHGTGTGATFPCLASGDGRWVGAGAEAGHVARVWSSYPFRHAVDLVNAASCQHHTAPSFSPDGRQVSALSINEIWTFEVGTWKRMARTRFADPELRVQPSDRDGKIAFVPRNDKVPARLVNVSTGRKLVDLEGSPGDTVALSDDGAWVAELDGSELILRAASSGKITKRIAMGHE